jgi:Fic family protein
LETIEDFHRILFREFEPDWAGRMRGPAPNFIPTNVIFGGRGGVDYGEVLVNCNALCAEIQRLSQMLDERVAGKSITDRDVVRVASFAHSELIRIHPFLDGNGRIARVCINYFCARYDLMPISIERPKGEYIDATGRWIDRRDAEPLADLLLPLIVRSDTGSR